MLNIIGQDDIFFCNNLPIFISSSGLGFNLSIVSGIDPDCWQTPWDKTIMPSAYILLLIVSLAAVWIYWQTSQDIFVLVGLAGLGCFVWGFSLAPWIVQLLIMVLLFGVQKCYLRDAQSFE
ncbi:hypothetical protein QUB60_23365 [Microcoleus sp. A2-C5]|uniref:hypothetical protein n=1 Tax=Microcoleaceae TaxID=1892252 RepID=UPI002236EFF0|nr:hypothetical protein [Lyngbya sp. CCAP 1446/10]